MSVTVTVAHALLDHFHMPDNHHHFRAKLVLDHQRFLFAHNSIILAWRTLNNKTCVHYRLMAASSCDPSSNSEVLINITSSENITLQHGDLLDVRNNSLRLYIISIDEGGIPCLVLETFQVKPGCEF